MANAQLEGAIIALYRNGNVVNISQATAQLTQAPEWRSKSIPSHPLISTTDVRRVVSKLEKDGVLVRDVQDGVTRFRFQPPEVLEMKHREMAANKRADFASHHVYEAINLHLNPALQALSSVVGGAGNYRTLRNATNTLRMVAGLIHDSTREEPHLKLDRYPVPDEERRYNLPSRRRRKKK